jgi:hypothetical protein
MVLKVDGGEYLSGEVAIHKVELGGCPREGVVGAKLVRKWHT